MQLSTTHDLIHGPMASGKTHTAMQMIAADRESDLLLSYVIDPCFDLAEVRDDVDQYARSPEEVRDLLAELEAEATARCEQFGEMGMRDFVPGDSRHQLKLIVVTVEDPDKVLNDSANLAAVAATLRMSRRAGIKFRWICPSLSITQFGCSETVRATLTGGNVLECEAVAA